MQSYPPPCPESANKLEYPFWALSPSTLCFIRRLPPPRNRLEHCSKGQAFAVREESCRIYWLLGRNFGVLHHIPAVTRHFHSCFLLYSSAKTYSEGSALPGITWSRGKQLRRRTYGCTVGNAEAWIYWKKQRHFIYWFILCLKHLSLQSEEIHVPQQ